MKTEKDFKTYCELVRHACIDMQGEKIHEFIIKRRVRQGCILSPILFNIGTENIFATALNDSRGHACGWRGKKQYSEGG